MGQVFSLEFLGTATSVGVPVIGCGCGVCRSPDARDKRLRASVLVRAAGTTVLVDSGPDLRQQALRAELSAVDAVLYTHEHLDHVAGFDELRAFCWHREHPLPLHATESCMKALRRMYGWAFSEDNRYKGYVKPDARLIDGGFAVGGLAVEPLPVEHAGVVTVGFLFQADGMKSVAYVPDVKAFPTETLERIRGVDVLVVDALRKIPHPTHMSVSEALDAAADVQARETWLTHLGHDTRHAELEADLPETVRVAWDGLVLDLGK